MHVKPVSVIFPPLRMLKASHVFDLKIQWTVTEMHDDSGNLKQKWLALKSMSVTWKELS